MLGPGGRARAREPRSGRKAGGRLLPWHTSRATSHCGSDSSVAFALVRFGDVATIALEECARRATGAVRPNRGVGISQNRASTLSSFRGRAGHSERPLTQMGAAAGVGCASGEYGVSWIAAPRALPSCWCGHQPPKASRGSQCPKAVGDRCAEHCWQMARLATQQPRDWRSARHARSRSRARNRLLLRRLEPEAGAPPVADS